MMENVQSAHSNESQSIFLLFSAM